MESPFRRPFPPDLRLIETLGWRPGAGFAHLDLHLARLARAARDFGVPIDRAALDRALAAARGDAPLRLRLTLALDGGVESVAAPLLPDPPVWIVRLAEERLDPDDPWLRVKTTKRARYDAARAALPEGVDEVLFLNTRGEVCEGAITNVFLETADGLITPHAASGLLPGVLRESLLRSGGAVERVLRPGDLRGGRLLVGNALRGLRPALLG